MAVQDSTSPDAPIPAVSPGARGWLKYLEAYQPAADQAGHHGSYHYPTTDREVDRSVDLQDQQKRQREQQLVREAQSFDWRVAIDFGCGTGAQFDCFDRMPHRDALLIGIEPDPQRAVAATAAARTLRYVRAIVAEGGQELLKNVPDELRADLVLCNQVFGHVSNRERRSIIDALQHVLRPGGRLILSVPVVSLPSTTMFPQLAGATADYTHWVDLRKPPTSADYREAVGSDAFDQQVSGRRAGLLPVRGFYLPDFPRCQADELPASCDTVPPTLVHDLGDRWTLESGWLYSIHGQVAGTSALVGDLLMSFGRAAK